jgi:hypothetical protein
MYKSWFCKHAITIAIAIAARASGAAFTLLLSELTLNKAAAADPLQCSQRNTDHF